MANLWCFAGFERSQINKGIIFISCLNTMKAKVKDLLITLSLSSISEIVTLVSLAKNAHCYFRKQFHSLIIRDQMIRFFTFAPPEMYHYLLVCLYFSQI